MRVGSRRGCRVTNEILVPFCLQYCRGCIRGKEKGVGQKVGQFHVQTVEHLVATARERAKR